MQNFGTLRQFLNFPPLSPQICDSAGGRGGPRLFFLIGILIFLLVRSPCKNLKPYDNPFWGFEQRHPEERKISASVDDIFGGTRVVFLKIGVGFRNFSWAPN